MSTDQVALSRKHLSSEVPMLARELTDFCLYIGVFGSIDSGRMAQITHQLTDKCESSESSVVIVDLANVDAIDTAVSTHLIRMGKVLQLIGVAVIFCGIKGNLARTMVSAGVEFETFQVVRDLKSALDKAYRLQGFAVVESQN